MPVFRVEPVESTERLAVQGGLHARVWIAFAVLAVSLTVLAVSPVLVSLRTRALRNTITEVAEPTISAAAGMERALALELAALRAFALHGDTTYLSRYRQYRADEREDSRRLALYAQRLDPDITRQVQRLESLAGAWHADVNRRLARAPAEGRASLGALDPETLLLEARSVRGSVELLERLRRHDIARVEAFEIWLNRAMILVVALAGVSLALLGRRLHALAAAADADRRELGREIGRRERLVRGMSHDLKNPLGVADAHAQFLESGVRGPLTDDQLRSVAAIRRAVGQTVRLIEDLLQLARAERGELPLRTVPVDFAALVSEVAEDTRSRAHTKQQRLQVSVPPTPVEGITDPGRVREIVDNLLSNALRYTPEGGDVELRLTPPDRETAGESRVRIAVSDNGPGIAPADQERIFEEFERAIHSEEGSGLGLAISREMARLLGGEIHLESEIGLGSTFTLVLPSRPGPPPGASGSGGSRKRPGRRAERGGAG